MRPPGWHWNTSVEDMLGQQARRSKDIAETDLTQKVTPAEATTKLSRREPGRRRRVLTCSWPGPDYARSVQRVSSDPSATPT